MFFGTLAYGQNPQGVKYAFSTCKQDCGYNNPYIYIYMCVYNM